VTVRARCGTARNVLRSSMKTVTVRLPEALLGEIEAEGRERKVSRSDVIRERLERAKDPSRRRAGHLDAIADIIGSVHGLPADLSSRVDYYLRKTGYGRDRPR
jgi:Arc/MetJ-type ribon-helix-helix transcriptional regulator